MQDTEVYITDTNRTEAALAQLFRHPVNIKRFSGWCNGAGGGTPFVQIHNSKTTPSVNAIPLWSEQLIGNDGFNFSFKPGDEIKCFTGLFIGLSTDETKYVADATGNKISGQMFVDDFEAYPGYTKTVVGDYTTNVANLQVWSNANQVTTPQISLQRLEVTNGGGTPCYFLIIARDATATGVKVIWSSPTAVAAAASAVYQFGPNGLQPFENIVVTNPQATPAQSTGNTIYQGCLVCACDATVPATSPLSRGLPNSLVAGNLNIRATYKS